MPGLERAATSCGRGAGGGVAESGAEKKVGGPGSRQQSPGPHKAWATRNADSIWTSRMHGSVTEEFLAFWAEKTAGDGDEVIALLEDEAAGDETGSPLVVFRAALAAISGNIFLGDAVDDRANSRPHAGAGAHRAGLVSRVEDEVRQVAAIAA